MRTGEAIIQNCVGQILTDGMFDTYLFNGILSNKINLTFLRFDSWICLDTDDWVSIHTTKENEMHEILSWIDDDNNIIEFPRKRIEFDYPNFRQFIGKKFLSFKELISSPIGDSCGLLLEFSDSKFLGIYSDNDEVTHYFFDKNIPDGLEIRNAQ
jgi:hypothetical protein